MGKINEKRIILAVTGLAFLLMLATASVCAITGREVPSEYWDFTKQVGIFFLGGGAVALFANGAAKKINGG